MPGRHSSSAWRWRTTSSTSELESECERKLGDLSLASGDVAGAERWYSRSLAVCRDAEDKRGEAVGAWCLARIDAARDDRGAARKRIAEALRAFKSFEMNAEAVEALADLAALLATSGEWPAAMRLQAAIASHRRALLLRPTQRKDDEARRDIANGRTGLGAAAFDEAWSDGAGWTLGRAIDYGLALPVAEESIATV